MSSPRLTRGRHSQVGAFYSVTTIARGREPWFCDALASRVGVGQLRASDVAGSTRTHAWVVMPDHVHWLFQLRAGSLSACMQRFKSQSARAIRTAECSSGSLWQAGFYDHCLRDDEDLVMQARYIVENPARNGLVERWQDYPHVWCRWELP